MKKPLLLLLLCSFHLSYADVCTSVGDGDWDDPANWSCGHMPTCGDVVYIKNLVTVQSTEDYTGCGSSMQIIIEPCGTLHFDNGSKLKLPCGSGVEFKPAAGGCPAGQLTSDGYSGNSESLQICGAVVWQAGDGPQSGPLVYGNTLPIELIYFRGDMDGDRVVFFWATATETNNDFFTLERSKDGKLWTNIIEVKGAGNSSSTIEYADFDEHPLNGVSYYRLKQTDFDGKYTYSEIVVIKNSTNTADITPFPNPSDGNSFNLEFTGFGDEELLVVLRDVHGKQFYSKVYVVADHSNIVGVDIEKQLPPGNYIITASSDENMISKKIIVK